MSEASWRVAAGVGRVWFDRECAVHKRVRSWSVWLQWAVLLSVLAGALAWVVGASEAPADREELKNVVAELRSQAAVGQLLSEQATTGKVTSPYFRAQASELRKNIEAARKQLDPSKFKPEVREASARALELASRLSEEAGALGGAYGDARAAGDLKGEFAGLFSQLMGLEESLKR
ncbi:MAG TPA: hypothetical protein VE713_12585 [Pyrinomonadaceae bacterium]|nr:hypothetical protein [Pyrinomonadaceae bacterium]